MRAERRERTAFDEIFALERTHVTLDDGQVLSVHTATGRDVYVRPLFGPAPMHWTLAAAVSAALGFRVTLHERGCWSRYEGSWMCFRWTRC